MLYSDRENKAWWDKLSKLERYELMEKIYERAAVVDLRRWSIQMQRKLDRGEEFNLKEIERLRKWE